MAHAASPGRADAARIRAVGQELDHVRYSRRRNGSPQGNKAKVALASAHRGHIDGACHLVLRLPQADSERPPATLPSFAACPSPCPSPSKSSPSSVPASERLAGAAPARCCDRSRNERGASADRSFDRDRSGRRSTTRIQRLKRPRPAPAFARDGPALRALLADEDDDEPLRDARDGPRDDFVFFGASAYGS